MRGFILNMIMVFVGFYLTVTGMFLSMESFKRNTIILTMIESAKIASVVNLDDSARVEENYVDIKDISYKYLRDKNNKIKAVSVKVTDSNDTDYRTVLKENTTY